VWKKGGCHPEMNNEESLGKEMSRRGFEKRSKVRKEEIERNGLKKERKVWEAEKRRKILKEEIRRKGLKHKR
jgi:hypothetical protein